MKRFLLVLIICLCAGSVMAQSFFGIPGFKMKNGFLYSRTTDSLYFVDSTGTDTTLLFYHDGADWQWAGASVPLSDSTGKLDTTYAGFTTYVSNHSVAGVDSVLYSDTAEVAKDLEAVTNIDLNDFDIADVEKITVDSIIGGTSLYIAPGHISASIDMRIAAGGLDIFPWGNNFEIFQLRDGYLYGGTFAHANSTPSVLWFDTIKGYWAGTAVTVLYGGTGATSLTDGSVLLGSGTNSITPMGVLADGNIIVGDGATDPISLGAFTSSTGTLKHEYGGLEDDVSGYTNGL